jgi:hypothetical protein
MYRNIGYMFYVGVKIALSYYVKKYRLREFRNSVLRKIIGPKREEERGRKSFIVSEFELSIKQSHSSRKHNKEG